MHISLIPEKYFNNRVIIREKKSLPKFVIRKTKDGAMLCKKHGDKITIIDRLLTNLYELPVKQLLNGSFKNLKVGNYQFYNEYNNDIILNKYTDNTNKYQDISNIEEFNKINIIFDGNASTIFKKLAEYKSIKDIIKTLTNKIMLVEDLEFLILDDNENVLKTYNFKKFEDYRETSDETSVIVIDIIQKFKDYDFSNIEINLNESIDVNFIRVIYHLYNFYNTNIKLSRQVHLNDRIYDINRNLLRTLKLKVENEELFKLMLNVLHSNKKYNSTLLTDIDFENLKNIKDEIYTLIKNNLKNK